MPLGIVNMCKHDGDFFLCYDALVHHYIFRCCTCHVFSLNFNPKDFLNSVAYTDRSTDQTLKILPKIDYKAGEL